MAGTVSARLRPMGSEDLDRVLVWRNHESVRRYMYTQHEITESEHRAWYTRASTDPSRHLLIYESKGVALGFAHLAELACGSIADWGFYNAPDAPRGTGSALGRLVLDYAFAQARLHKVCGQALAYNQRSIEFHQKMGFSREGVLRDQHFDGEAYHDVICFGLLASQWQSLS